MKKVIGYLVGILAALVLFSITSPALGQAGAALDRPNPPVDRAIIRVIRDPHTGVCWLLEQGTGRPGGPGRMIQETLEQIPLISAASTTNSSASALLAAQKAVILAGDQVIVEEHSGQVDARLEAVALAPARAGARLNVRLTIGGKILRAIAIGPGRATLAESQEMRQ